MTSFIIKEGGGAILFQVLIHQHISNCANYLFTVSKLFVAPIKFPFDCTPHNGNAVCTSTLLLFPLGGWSPCVQQELPVVVIAPCHLAVAVRKCDRTYAAVSCHRATTTDSATIAIIPIHSDDTDVQMLLFFVIYDAMVTQAASIKHYTNVYCNKPSDMRRCWWEDFLNGSTLSVHSLSRLTGSGETHVRRRVTTLKKL